ncbi:aminotransferase [Pelovirga terrestris]|uniref:Aminotransferase n=1 Tax=Pelovirga terrestris TaxID=2771352 RepID=A0A8J6UN79_9BACT|nr:aminotransferase [Pelovirga terrestris]MBD1399074.1 aminotransferase [Pelovirga terrestris]
MKINSRLYQVQPPPITEVKSWLDKHRSSKESSLLDLCQAVPNYPPAPQLIAHLNQTLDDPATYRYSPDEGLPEVRTDLCNWYQRHYQSGPQPDQVCLTIGASQAFWLAMLCLCQPGDEVIVPLPAYFDHLMALQSYGVTPSYIPFDPNSSGIPDLATIEQKITPRTRALLLVTPSNPTGATIPPQQLEQLLDLAQARSIVLILDETYNCFIGAAPHQLFARSNWQQHFVHLASFGKTFALTGLRCGALIGAIELIEQGLKIQDSMVVCQPRPAQLALQYGCNHLDGWIAEKTQLMQQRHAAVSACFDTGINGFELTASGSFFAWVKHPWNGISGRQAARKLLDKVGIICLPGEAFGPDLEPYLRLAFGNLETDQINELRQRLEEL